MRGNRRILLKPIGVSSEVTSSIHENVSEGFYQIDAKGNRTYIPYSEEEKKEVHSFISPSRKRYAHMKWTKTHKWKNQDKAKKSKWKRHVTFGGLNTK